MAPCQAVAVTATQMHLAKMSSLTTALRRHAAATTLLQLTELAGRFRHSPWISLPDGRVRLLSACAGVLGGEFRRH